LRWVEKERPTKEFLYELTLSVEWGVDGEALTRFTQGESENEAKQED